MSLGNMPMQLPANTHAIAFCLIKRENLWGDLFLKQPLVVGLVYSASKPKQTLVTTISDDKLR